MFRPALIDPKARYPRRIAQTHPRRRTAVDGVLQVVNGRALCARRGILLLRASSNVRPGAAPSAVDFVEIELQNRSPVAQDRRSADRAAPRDGAFGDPLALELLRRPSLHDEGLRPLGRRGRAIDQPKRDPEPRELDGSVKPVGPAPTMRTSVFVMSSPGGVNASAVIWIQVSAAKHHRTGPAPPVREGLRVATMG